MAVVDASVAVRWFIHGPGSDRAASRQEQTDLVAPDLICAEVGNALWRYLRRGDINADEAAAILAMLPANFGRLVPSAELVAEALRIAGAVDHPIYDCLYLALARREQAQLVTLDRSLAEIAGRLGIKVDLLL